jgi:PAS domain S-box-containing protein
MLANSSSLRFAEVMSSPAPLVESADGALPVGAQGAQDRCESLDTRYERLRQAFAVLMERQYQLEEQLQSMQDVHLVTDVQGVVLAADPVSSLISPTHRLVGSTLGDWVLPSHQDNYRHLMRCAAHARATTHEERELHLQREAAYAAPFCALVHVIGIEEGGRVDVVHWVMRPMHAQQEKHFLPHKPKIQFQRAAEGVLIVDAASNIVVSNAAFTRITGYTNREVVGRNPRFLQSGLQDKAFYQDLWQELSSSGTWQGLLLNRRKSGAIYPQWTKLGVTRNSAGNIVGYTEMFHDLSRTLATQTNMESESELTHVYGPSEALESSQSH